MKMVIFRREFCFRKFVVSAFTAVIGMIAISGSVCNSPAFADVQRYNVPVDNSPQKGPKDAPVTIIEFLDFQ